MERINALAISSKEKQDAISPKMAIDLLKAGNKRFVENTRVNRDLSLQVAQTADGQYPFAVVLGCIDSRVPAELIFDQGIGDLFIARVAGNFVNEDILGSLEFACKVAGAKAVVVLGHSSCGAVKGACDDVKLGNLTHMLANIMPAVDSVKDANGERNSSNPEFVQKVADANVCLTIDKIKEQSPVLKEMFDNDEIEIVGGMYDVASGLVKFY
jgi:carbonic anhydrase